MDTISQSETACSPICVDHFPRAHPHGRFEVSLVRRGQQTCIRDRYISYPFHMTRPFALDSQIPQLLTLYQQSSSGGLYQGEKLGSVFQLDEGAAAYVTNQSATLVHHCYDSPCCQTMTIEARGMSFFIYAPESTILFPGAWLDNKLKITMSDQAHILLHESFTWHDPHQTSGKVQNDPALFFKQISSQIHVEDEQGQLKIRDVFCLKGCDVMGKISPMADWKLCSSFLLLGQEGRLPKRQDLEAIIQWEGQSAGMSSLPNKTGFFIRSLSKSTEVTRTLTTKLSELVTQNYFGAPLAVRRK